MASRSYGHYCAVARALDVVGERWSLLVVRELLDGPKRYVDLLSGLAGISTDVLAARLKTLEQAGLVARRTLPPPAASKVYELTPLGRDLQPAMTELARWGIRLLGEQRDSDAFHINWITLSLRAAFQPGAARGLSLTVEFQIGPDALHARIEDGDIEIHADHAADPDVVVAVADAATLAEIGRDPRAAVTAVSSGRLRMQGEGSAVESAARAFRFS